MSVEQLKKKVMEELKWDNRVDAESIEVELNSEGVVRLKGQVPSYSVKRAAEKDVQFLNGVSSVVNKLKVLYPSSVKPPKDKKIFSTIMNIFRSNENIDAETIDLTVNSGSVILNGNQDAYWKKIKVEKMVSEISHVIEVTNNLEVIPKEDYNDESIREDIISALDRSAFVNPEDLKISVENGVVKLTGTLSNWKSHNAVLRIVSFTSGVKDIKNELLIKTYL